jgi:hypothetical protein
MSETINVKISELAELAIEAWRLQHWAFMSGFERDRTIPRRTTRSLNCFLTEMGFELCDLAGQPYDPGLAVEVVDTERDTNAPMGSAWIGETVSPIVLWRGQMVRTGQVVVRYGPEINQEIK